MCALNDSSVQFDGDSVAHQIHSVNRLCQRDGRGQIIEAAALAVDDECDGHTF